MSSKTRTHTHTHKAIGSSSSNEGADAKALVVVVVVESIRRRKGTDAELDRAVGLSLVMVRSGERGKRSQQSVERAERQCKLESLD